MKNANKVALVFKENGVPMGASFDLNEAKPLTELLSAEPLGPFLIEVTLKSVAMPDKEIVLPMLAAINEGEIHVFSKKFPFFAKLTANYDLKAGAVVDFEEVNYGEIDYIGMLDADEIPHGDYFYFKFSHGKLDGNYITAMWSVKDQCTYSIPFYNFQTNGQSCLGGGFPRNANAFAQLLWFLNCYTSPHETYDGGGAFRFKVPKEWGKLTATKIKEKINNAKDDPLELQFGGKKGKWPRQSKNGSWLAPPSIANLNPNTKVIGKLQPLI